MRSTSKYLGVALSALSLCGCMASTPVNPEANKVTLDSLSLGKKSWTTVIPRAQSSINKQISLDQGYPVLGKYIETFTLNPLELGGAPAINEAKEAALSLSETKILVRSISKDRRTAYGINGEAVVFKGYTYSVNKNPSEQLLRAHFNQGKGTEDYKIFYQSELAFHYALKNKKTELYGDAGKCVSESSDQSRRSGGWGVDYDHLGMCVTFLKEMTPTMLSQGKRAEVKREYEVLRTKENKTDPEVHLVNLMSESLIRSAN